MKTSELLHFAFRARDPLALGRWYAGLFEGQFFLHPVMSGLGIVIVKINHPEGVFDGRPEFWPWDLVWGGAAAVFRKVEAQPSPTSYGHVAVKVAAETDAICAELKRRGISYRMEPRATGFLIPVVDDPEGNMIELFPNIDHMPIPEKALCPPDLIDEAITQIRTALASSPTTSSLARAFRSSFSKRRCRNHRGSVCFSEFRDGGSNRRDWLFAAPSITSPRAKEQPRARSQWLGNRDQRNPL